MAGDLLVFFDLGIPGSDNTPPEFLPIVSASSSNLVFNATYRIADGSEGGATIPGLPTGDKIIAQFKAVIGWHYEQFRAMEDDLAERARIYTREWEHFFKPRGGRVFIM